MAASDVARRRRYHVLLVDDDPATLFALKSMLESCDFAVSCAHGANEALVEIDDKWPDVILTDVYMDDGDGFELLNTMQATGRDIPIVCMSGGTHIGDYDPLFVASRLGASGVIEKPFTAAEIRLMLSEAIIGGEPRVARSAKA